MARTFQLVPVAGMGVRDWETVKGSMVAQGWALDLDQMVFSREVPDEPPPAPPVGRRPEDNTLDGAACP